MSSLLQFCSSSEAGHDWSWKKQYCLVGNLGEINSCFEWEGLYGFGCLEGSLPLGLVVLKLMLAGSCGCDVNLNKLLHLLVVSCSLGFVQHLSVHLKAVYQGKEYHDLHLVHGRTMGWTNDKTAPSYIYGPDFLHFSYDYSIASYHSSNSFFSACFECGARSGAEVTHMPKKHLCEQLACYKCSQCVSFQNQVLRQSVSFLSEYRDLN